MRDVWFAPLVGGGVLPAPLGGNPPEVAARVLPLSIVAHGVSVSNREKGGRGWKPYAERDGRESDGIVRPNPTLYTSHTSDQRQY